MICEARIDDRGRITLPLKFLKANRIKINSTVGIYPIGGRTDAIRIEFNSSYLGGINEDR
tara:strand:+ start:7306 stop:7485 length:180 start_codon:yes stop_codon:yes gene_type:complete